MEFRKITDKADLVDAFTGAPLQESAQACNHCDVFYNPSSIDALTIIATCATPEDERNYGVEDDGKRSRKLLAAGPRL